MNSAHRPVAILAAIAAVFFALTWSAGMPQGGQFNSPDETANAYWAGRISDAKPLELRDEAVGLGQGAVHPRSMAVAGDRLVPGSFPGMLFIYGALRLVTRIPLDAMTPLFTAVAGLLLFRLMTRVVGEKTAFWTAVLFYLHPAVLYYTGRGLFHNVLFVDLLITAAALAVLTNRRVAAGIVFGFALITRASEIVWAVPLALGLLIYFERTRWKSWLPAVAGVLLPLLLWGWYNAATYGSPFRTAYTPPARVSTEQAVLPEITAPPSELPLSERILPFGFHPRLVVRHFRDYGLRLFWWYAAFAGVGYALAIARWKTQSKPVRALIVVTAIVAGWLAILYGSWYFRDNLDPNAVTIGTSYVRYFMPIYVLSLPFAAMMLLLIREKAGRPHFAIAIAGLFAALGFQAAFVEGDESLASVRRTLQENAAKRATLLAAIPEDAVVVTQRFDKIVFPDRIRIIPDGSWGAAARLADRFPVLWYGIEPGPEERAKILADADAAGLAVDAMSSPIPGELMITFTPKP